MKIACIGSRGLTPAQLDICEKLGAWIVRSGHIVQSGNALGADQAFGRGANSVDPSKLHLFLPWGAYEAQAVHPDNVVYVLEQLDSGQRIIYHSLAAKYHPSYKFLSQGAQKLMARNSGIVLGTDMVIAWPSEKKGGGGTGQGMRLADGEKIRLIDLRLLDQDGLFHLCEEIAQLGKEKA